MQELNKGQKGKLDELAVTVENLTREEREVLAALLTADKGGTTDAIGAIVGELYTEVPVSMIEFIESREYLNVKGIVHPMITQILIEVDRDNIREAYLGLGKGSGKSYGVSCFLCRGIYRLLCLKKPQETFRLAPTSSIAAINLSTGREQAKNVIFHEFMGKVKGSPWFEGKFKDKAYEVEFPKSIYAYSGSSASSAWQGYNTIYGALDEVCWMTDNQEKSVADELSTALQGSMITRFSWAYKLLEISSLRSEDDYLLRQIDYVKKTGVELDESHPFFHPAPPAAVA